ncbi:alpha/beta hydrolase [Candidatus Saccharibacteria bacterium]|nr:alpha/beta hydrolase [Candidatus Saccharibacteria bacterium]
MLSNEFYSNEDSKTDTLACLVAGFGGRLKSYQKAIQALLNAGYDVIAFEYDRNVLDSGNPDDLLNLVESITKEVEGRASSYERVVCCGVSLGAYISFNVQRRIDNAKTGIYGTAGISVSHAIYTAKIFRKVRSKFVGNGYDEASLRKKWESIEILDDAGIDSTKSLKIVMGKMDKIVRYRSASRVMDGWKDNGTKVSYFGLNGRGHTLTISWYKNNLSKLLI